MKPEEARAAIDGLLKQGKEACGLAKSAAKHRKSLSGDNFYGNKFHEVVIALSKNEAKVSKLAAGKLEGGEATKLSSSIETLKSTTTMPNKARADALKQVSLICQSVLLPRIESMTANPVPETEQVLP